MAKDNMEKIWQILALQHPLFPSHVVTGQGEAVVTQNQRTINLNAQTQPSVIHSIKIGGQPKENAQPFAGFKVTELFPGDVGKLAMGKGVSYGVTVILLCKVKGKEKSLNLSCVNVQIEGEEVPYIAEGKNVFSDIVEDKNVFSEGKGPWYDEMVLGDPCLCYTPKEIIIRNITTPEQFNAMLRGLSITGLQEPLNVTAVARVHYYVGPNDRLYHGFEFLAEVQLKQDKPLPKEVVDIEFYDYEANAIAPAWEPEEVKKHASIVGGIEFLLKQPSLSDQWIKYQGSWLGSIKEYERHYQVLDFFARQDVKAIMNHDGYSPEKKVKELKGVPNYAAIFEVWVGLLKDSEKQQPKTAKAALTGIQKWLENTAQIIGNEPASAEVDKSDVAVFKQFYDWCRHIRMFEAWLPAMQVYHEKQQYGDLCQVWNPCLEEYDQALIQKALERKDAKAISHAFEIWQKGLTGAISAMHTLVSMINADAGDMQACLNLWKNAITAFGEKIDEVDTFLSGVKLGADKAMAMGAS